jgi:hypothetical protein
MRALVDGGGVPTATDGLEIVETVAAGYESHDRGVPVRVGSARSIREFAWA